MSSSALLLEPPNKLSRMVLEPERWLSRSKVLAAKPDDLSSLPETHTVEEEDGLLQVAL